MLSGKTISVFVNSVSRLNLACPISVYRRSSLGERNCRNPQLRTYHSILNILCLTVTLQCQTHRTSASIPSASTLLSSHRHEGRRPDRSSQTLLPSAFQPAGAILASPTHSNHTTRSISSARPSDIKSSAFNTGSSALWSNPQASSQPDLRINAACPTFSSYSNTAISSTRETGAL